MPPSLRHLTLPRSVRPAYVDPGAGHAPSENRPATATHVPERKYDKTPGRLPVVNVISHPRQVQAAKVGVTCGGGSGADAGLLHQEVQRFFKIDSNCVRCSQPILCPPNCGPFNLRSCARSDLNRQHLRSSDASQTFEQSRGGDGFTAIGLGDGCSQLILQFCRDLKCLIGFTRKNGHDRPFRE